MNATIIHMSNELKSFYKYYSFESGLKTLSEGKIKWSSPYIFNDPFDNQCDIILRGNIFDFNNCGAEMLQDHLLGNNKIKDPDIETQKILKLFETIPKENIPIFIKKIKTQKIFTENMFNSWKESFNKNLKILMRNSSIFCFSEDYENILMWSHYAENHEGIVVNFVDYPPADSPIKLAEKVIYNDNLPTFEIYDLLKRNVDIKKIHDVYTLTKAKCWEYEKEWRIITTLRNPINTFEIIPFALNEVQNIYLGCRISQENERKIVEIVKEKYPWAKVYKAYKNPIKFALDFSLLYSSEKTN